MLKDLTKTPLNIFRAYDIRGTYPDELNEAVVFNIAVAFGSEAQAQGEKKVVIARDGRLSSPVLSHALSEGLQASGCEVIDIGAVPTPVLYFATAVKGTGTGVVLTGSHNPGDYNGLKMMIAGKTLAQNDIQDLKQRILERNVVTGAGNYRAIDVVEDYIGTICEKEAFSRPFKVVVDAGNGIAGKVAPALFTALSCEVIPLFCEVDGSFPNHHPNPSDPNNLKDLIRAVKDNNADIGFAFDGDGDRLGVVTPKGENIFPDRQLMLYAQSVIKNKPGAVVVFDVKCSKNVTDFIASLGGKPVMYKTGHALIKQKIKACHADLAGEMSGHIFFNDRWFGFDDGLYTAVRLLNILSQSDKSIDEIFEDIPQSVSTPEINMAVPEDKKFELMKMLLERSKTQFPGENIITIDGVRVEFSDGWGLVRASNTTPCLVMRFEADSADALERIQHKFTHWVQQTIALGCVGG